MPIPDLHQLGCELMPAFSPAHPLVQLFPGLGNRSRRNGSVANLFGPDQEARGTDWHRNVDQYWVQRGHTYYVNERLGGSSVDRLWVR